MTLGRQNSFGSASAADAEVGRIIDGRYALLAPLGAGASATVYLAQDESLRRKVAVKLLHPALVGDDKFRRRFRAEAQSAAQMSHPHLMAIHDWGDEDEAYLVTELLSGGSLRQMIDAGHLLSPSQALVVGLHAAEGLAHAHEQGFVHRDIKPANLLFGLDGRLRVADFGIARAVAEAAWTEPEGALIGTARYAAPEQASGSEVDQRADMYSLALTIIEGVTGTVPLVESTPLATMLIRQDRDVPYIEELGPLAPVMEAAGRADRSERPSTTQFITELNAAAASLPRPLRLPLVGVDSLLAAAGSAQSAGFDARTGDVDLRDAGSITRQQPAVGSAARAFPSIEDQMDLERTDQDEPKKRNWPWAIMAVLLLVSLVGIVQFGRSSRGGAEDAQTEDSQALEPVADTPIGTYVGRTLAESTNDLELSDLTFATIERREDESVAGQVLEQTPQPGELVSAGYEVTLVVSLGPELRVVPDLVGLTLSEAKQLALDSHLVLGSVALVEDEVVPSGSVVSMGSELGVEMESGSRIDVVLSDGPATRTVPTLFGLDPQSATALLAESGLVYAQTEEGEFSEDVAEGLVVSVDVAAGSQAERDSTVTVVLSRGLPFVQIPDIRGKTGSEAATILADAGFEVSGVDGSPNNEVIETRPPIGEAHRKGTSVTIFTR